MILHLLLYNIKRKEEEEKKKNSISSPQKRNPHKEKMDRDRVPRGGERRRRYILRLLKRNTRRARVVDTIVKCESPLT